MEKIIYETKDNKSLTKCPYREKVYIGTADCRKCEHNNGTGLSFVYCKTPKITDL